MVLLFWLYVCVKSLQSNISSISYEILNKCTIKYCKKKKKKIWWGCDMCLWQQERGDRICISLLFAWFCVIGARSKFMTWAHVSLLLGSERFSGMQDLNMTSEWVRQIPTPLYYHSGLASGIPEHDGSSKHQCRFSDTGCLGSIVLNTFWVKQDAGGSWTSEIGLHWYQCSQNLRGPRFLSGRHRPI